MQQWIEEVEKMECSHFKGNLLVGVLVGLELAMYLEDRTTRILWRDFSGW